MRFKIGETDVKISFTFFALLLLCFIDKYKPSVITSLFVSLLHELIHLFSLLALKCRVRQFKLSIFGGNIVREQAFKSTYLNEIIINISAPVFNIILGIIFLTINKNNLFGIVNLVLGVFNILPFYNFDGGITLWYIIKIFSNDSFAEKIITTTSFLVLVCFTILTLKSLSFDEINISVVLINIYFFLFFLYRIFNKKIDMN